MDNPFDEPTYKCGRCLDRIYVYTKSETGPKGTTYNFVSPCAECDAGRAVCAGLLFREFYSRHGTGKPVPRHEKAHLLKAAIARYGMNALAIQARFESIVRREQAQPFQAD